MFTLSKIKGKIFKKSISRALSLSVNGALMTCCRIYNAQPGDEGRYICTVQNEISTVRDTCYLRVQGNPT